MVQQVAHTTLQPQPHGVVLEAAPAEQLRLPNRMPSEGRHKGGRIVRTVDKCAPLSDAWWRCVLEGQGHRARVDEAQSLVSQTWGLMFEGGEIVHNGATLGAYHATKGWLTQYRACQLSLWEEYRAPVGLMRREYQAIRRLVNLGDKGCTSIAQERQDTSLLAVACRHSWALRGNVSAPGIFCDPCPAGGLLPLICWAILYGFAPWPPGHQQMF